MKRVLPTHLDLVIEAALSAGKAILEIYNLNETSVEFKDDDSPLTKADIASHNIIKNALEVTQVSILSEEGEEMDVQTRLKQIEIWIVDPLDGTKEFINRNGEFTVNIALVKNQIPILGVVYAPVTKELYFAAENYGSYKFIVDSQKNYNLSEIKEQAKKLPGKIGSIDDFKVVGSRSHMNRETENYISELRMRYDKVETASRGSSLKLCMVAEGSADCYPRFAPTMEWDTAAGHAICKYSGVDVIDWKSKSELLYNKVNLLNNWFLIERIR